MMMRIRLYNAKRESANEPPTTVITVPADDAKYRVLTLPGAVVITEETRITAYFENHIIQDIEIFEN